MLTPAEAIASVLARLQRRRRGATAPPAAVSPSLSPPVAKSRRHRIYWDKARMARQDYETKGGAHG